MVKVRDNLTNKIFNRLIVVKQAEDYVNPKGVHFAQWECRCKCGNQNTIIVTSAHLKNGHTQSCGCLNKESHIKHNSYDITGEYGIGYTSKGEEFYFDLEDYDKIKDYTWYIDKKGYIVSDTYNKHTKLHKLILNSYQDLDVDHKYGNKTRHDNRKANLRICSRTQNSVNKTNISSNTSGCMGVTWNKVINKWQVRITVNKQTIYLGSFNDFEEAQKTRLLAEKKYFGEFAPIRKDVAE